MSETKHTPGPWTIFTEPDRAVKIECGPRSICKLPFYTDAENEANARLIAAAPELLDALKLLRDACDLFLHNEDEAEAIAPAYENACMVLGQFEPGEKS